MSDKKTARFEKFSEKCPECGGFGTITRYYGGGQFVSTIDCERCVGRGAIGNCPECQGTGQIQEKTSTGTQSPGTSTECAKCMGCGSLGDCTACGGTGVAEGDDHKECPQCHGYGFNKKAQE